MGLFFNLKGSRRTYSESITRKVNQIADNLFLVIDESLQVAGASPDLETKKASLEFAMKKVIELISLVNQYSFINTRRISETYTSIRDIRNEIKLLETRRSPFVRREVA